MKIIAKTSWIWLLSLLIIVAPACNTSKSARGAAIGGAAGGVIGGVIGNKSGNTAVGVIVGAAIGGTAGALIGKYMDKQAKEIEESVEGAEVVRVGEGILVTFDSGLLFNFDSYALTAATKSNLQELATTLNEYEDTELTIEGHTDSKGTDAYNLDLSKKRARSVADYLVSLGVERNRLSTVGYGEQQPVNTENTEAAENRRVEVAIYANENLKEQARSGELTY
jgi:outer membrane protein OmpA-like peptidoglycan-associated protein